MNRRKRTNSLDHRAVRRLDNSRYQAAEIGQPLNCFVTIAPCRGQDRPPDNPAGYFADFRNWLGVWVRRRIPTFTAIWTIENIAAGTDPHMHILMHLPARLIAELREALARQYPGDRVTHVRRDDGQTKLHPSGFIGSTLNYMRKQMTPQAWWALGKQVRRSASGPFTGRRWGTTLNINARSSLES